jgi:hypothetical protein
LTPQNQSHKLIQQHQTANQTKETKMNTFSTITEAQAKADFMNLGRKSKVYFVIPTSNGRFRITTRKF